MIQRIHQRLLQLKPKHRQRQLLPIPRVLNNKRRRSHHLMKIAPQRRFKRSQLLKPLCRQRLNLKLLQRKTRAQMKTLQRRNQRLKFNQPKERKLTALQRTTKRNPKRNRNQPKLLLLPLLKRANTRRSLLETFHSTQTSILLESSCPTMEKFQE